MKIFRSLFLTLLIVLMTSTVSFARQERQAQDDTLDTAQDEGQNTYEITLKNRHFTPDPSQSVVLPEKADGGRHYVLLQFDVLPEAEELPKFDILSLNYVSPNTILATVPNGFDWHAVPALRWMGQLQAADKVSAPVTEQFEAAAVGASLTIVVEAFSDVSARQLDTLIIQAGATADFHPDLPGHIRLATGSPEALAQLAAAEEVAWMMPANDSLINKDPIYYCEGAATVYGPVPNFTTVGEGWDGPGLGAADLTYHFVNGTPDIAGSAEQIVIEQAMADWAAVADLTFTESNTPGLSDSIDILWGAGSHGDGYPFDGPSGVLAHAFYPSPPNSEPIAGDMHFDEAESWSLTGNIHMYSVALHELGHSLGLGHSSVPGAVMEPFYTGPISGLQADDIAGIRSLYDTSDDTICSGSTTPGATNWVDYWSNGVYVDINTSACGFTSTPVYHATLGGTGWHWEARGASSIYLPTPTGFRVYIHLASGIDPALANARNWHINWTATPNNLTSSRLCTGQTTSGSTNWINYWSNGIYVDIDTSACGFTEVPLYLTSIGGTSAHWITTGASSIYIPTATGFRVFINYDSGVTPTEANARNWHINWMAVPYDTITADFCSGRTTPGSTNWVNYRSDGIYVDLETDPCGLDAAPRYMTSMGGSSSQWISLGATSIYLPTATGMRTYINYSSGITAAQANAWNWHMNWMAVP